MMEAEGGVCEETEAANSPGMINVVVSSCHKLPLASITGN